MSILDQVINLAVHAFGLLLQLLLTIFTLLATMIRGILAAFGL